MKPSSLKLPQPERRRSIPPHFSWIDHRLVRDGHLQRCRSSALALYLFLITVADRQGLSYYQERTIGAMLHWNQDQLQAARDELVRHQLIAYEPPLYQVLSLDPKPAQRAAVEPKTTTASKPPTEPPATTQQISAMIAEWMTNHSQTKRIES